MLTMLKSWNIAWNWGLFFVCLYFVGLFWNSSTLYNGRFQLEKWQMHRCWLTISEKHLNKINLLRQSCNASVFVRPVISLLNCTNTNWSRNENTEKNQIQTNKNLNKSLFFQGLAIEVAGYPLRFDKWSKFDACFSQGRKRSCQTSVFWRDILKQHTPTGMFHTIIIIIIIITRPWPAFGRLGLGGSSGGYSSHE